MPGISLADRADLLMRLADQTVDRDTGMSVADRADLLMRLADETVDRDLRLSLERQALALAQSAEETAREEGRIRAIADAIVWSRQPQQQRGFFPLEAEPAAREIMKRLANAGYKIVAISR